jgi:hypothetical protein
MHGTGGKTAARAGGAPFAVLALAGLALAGSALVPAVPAAAQEAASAPAAPNGAAPAPTADEVAARAFAVTGGREGAARVAFTLTDASGERRFEFAMLYKHYPDGDIASKVVFFPEFPPDRKGYAWLGHLAREGTRADDAAWMYLPDLQVARRIQGADENDPFHDSVLGRAELSPRPPDLDTHKLLGMGDLDGHPVWVLETLHGGAFPYPRTVRWITRDDYLTLRAEHHAPSGRVARRVDTTWRKVGENWVWDKVTAVDPDSGASATLVVTDLRIDPGLSERAFTPAALRGAPDRYFPPAVAATPP